MVGSPKLGDQRTWCSRWGPRGAGNRPSSILVSNAASLDHVARIDHQSDELWDRDLRANVSGASTAPEGDTRCGIVSLSAVTREGACNSLRPTATTTLHAHRPLAG
jgi:hypothetical protein